MEHILQSRMIKTLFLLTLITAFSIAGFFYWVYMPAKGTELDGFVAVTGNKHAVILTGDDYGLAYIGYLGSGTDRFDELGLKIKKILESEYGYEEVYFEKTKKGFLQRMKSIDVNEGDQLMVLLLAHGGQARDGSDFLIWVSGEEQLTGTELNNSLNRFENSRIFVFVSSCGSGNVIKKITAVNRIIMTSGIDKNINTGVPTFNFIKALERKAADENKDGKVSVAELFNFMKIGIEKDYNEVYKRWRLHGADVIQIDDNADGRSVNNKLPFGSEGHLAMETFI